MLNICGGWNVKQDNSNLSGKLALRRYFMSRYHAEGAYVFDAFQGSGVIWPAHLLREFPNTRYWGVDVVPRKGRMAINCLKILRSKNLPFDVIDLDCYGFPWRYLSAVLKNINRPTTVFITLGSSGNMKGMTRLTDYERAILRIPFPVPMCPGVIVRDLVIKYVVQYISGYGIIVIEAKQAVINQPTQYIGLRLEKNK